MQNIAPRTLVADELAADLNVLRADNDDLLALEKLLGHDRGKTTKEVTLGVDDNSLTQHTYISKKFSTASLLEPPPPQNDRRRREEEEKDPSKSIPLHPSQRARSLRCFPCSISNPATANALLRLRFIFAYGACAGRGGGGLAAFAFSFSLFPLRGKRERGKKVRVAPRSSPPPKKNHQKPPPTTRPATAGLVVSFFTLRKGPSDMVFFSRGKNERGLSPG